MWIPVRGGGRVVPRDVNYLSVLKAVLWDAWRKSRATASFDPVERVLPLNGNPCQDRFLFWQSFSRGPLFFPQRTNLTRSLPESFPNPRTLGCTTHPSGIVFGTRVPCSAESSRNVSGDRLRGKTGTPTCLPGFSAQHGISTLEQPCVTAQLASADMTACRAFLSRILLNHRTTNSARRGPQRREPISGRPKNSSLSLR